MGNDKEYTTGGGLFYDNANTAPEAFPAVGVPSENADEDRAYYALLRPARVIRDPVHGDIWLTDLESFLVDQPFFQRLRRMRQLGLSDYVYPGAHHSRFEHSIGVLYVADRIIKHVNFNHTRRTIKTNLSEIDIAGFTNKDIIITRLLALLHDLAHFPYGHTLEDEGRIFGEKAGAQWADSDRYSLLGSNIKDAIKDFLNDKSSHLREYMETSFNGDGHNFPMMNNVINNAMHFLEYGSFDKNILGPLFSLLKAEELGEQAIIETDYPYIADVVGNTICADLLDYLRRDAYYTGLGMVYDDRILSHFVLAKSESESSGNEKKRLALLIQRQKRPIRVDVLSYIMDLLQQRYSLAEKVYTHRVKRLFSAMVITATSNAMSLYSNNTASNISAFKRDLITDVPSSLNKNVLRNTDESLLLWLSGLTHQPVNRGTKKPNRRDAAFRAASIAKSIIKREKYYELVVYKEIKSFYNRDSLSNDVRLDIENRLSKLFTLFINEKGIEHESIVIIYPGRPMRAKIPLVKVYVQTPRAGGKRLLAFVDYIREEEDKNISNHYSNRIQSMESAYDNLGKTVSVYIDPVTARELEIGKYEDAYTSGISAIIVQRILSDNYKKTTIKKDAEKRIDSVLKLPGAELLMNSSNPHLYTAYEQAVRGIAAGTLHTAIQKEAIELLRELFS